MRSRCRATVATSRTPREGHRRPLGTGGAAGTPCGQHAGLSGGHPPPPHPPSRLTGAAGRGPGDGAKDEDGEDQAKRRGAAHGGGRQGRLRGPGRRGQRDTANADTAAFIGGPRPGPARPERGCAAGAAPGRSLAGHTRSWPGASRPRGKEEAPPLLGHVRGPLPPERKAPCVRGIGSLVPPGTPGPPYQCRLVVRSQRVNLPCVQLHQAWDGHRNLEHRGTVPKHGLLLAIRLGNMLPAQQGGQRGEENSPAEG